MTLAAGAPRPRAWPALAAYAAAFFASIAAGAGLVGGTARARTGSDPARFTAEVARIATSIPGLSAVAALDALVLAGVALLAARWLAEGRAVLRLGPSRASPAGLAAAIAGTAGASLACGAACDLAGAGRAGVMEVISDALRATGAGGVALALLALSIAPGLGEELFFRGLMQGRLRAAWGRWPGVLGAAAAFGVLHLDVAQGLVAFAVGSYLGFVADRFGSIRPSMAAHAANNALFLLVAHASAGGHATRAEGALALGAGAALCLGATALLRAPRALAARVGSSPASTADVSP